jgi:hypothetical protein
MQHSKTLPAIPRALARKSTLHGVAPCANAPAVLPTYSPTGRFVTGYRTHVPRAANARTREAIRVDVVRLRGAK